MLDYQTFLESKRLTVPDVGMDVDPASLHPLMKPHQRAVCAQAIRRGRGAVWLDTGLGKSLVFLEWAQKLIECGVAKRVLLLAPLGVAQQFVRDEAPRWGYEVTYARHEQEAPATGITVTNYERLANFSPGLWPAVALDEADILANFAGKTKRALIGAFRHTPYRLTLTATPAPNDTVELCNQADFLGVMSQADMLSTFFISKGDDQKDGRFRLKRHAHDAFFRWLAQWAVACKKPSDLGFSDEGYTLPPLEIVPEFLPVEWVPPGQLFLTELKGVVQRAEVRRDTIDRRCDRVAELVSAEPSEPWLLWYGLLDEAERLERGISGAVVLRGGDDAERKADVLLDFARGNIACLVTHAKIAGAGMNFQRCARTAFVGLSDSYRTYYQGLRRFWRFGQTRAVRGHIVLSEPERPIFENVLRKEREHNTLTTGLIAAMRDFERAELVGQRVERDPYEPTKVPTRPTWLQSVVAA